MSTLERKVTEMTKEISNITSFRKDPFLELIYLSQSPYVPIDSLFEWPYYIPTISAINNKIKIRIY